MAYFDNNATTPLSEAAKQALNHAYERHWHNASGLYSSAAQTKIQLDDARNQLAEILDCEPELIVFNSGATEANNALFQYFANQSPENSTVAVSSIEHPAVLESAHYYFPEHCTEIPVDHNGLVTVEAVNEIIETQNPVLISVMAANNETGVLQPWREILELCKSKKIPFHSDAAQWIGKMPATELGHCDFLTASAHKFGGPKGIGLLKISETHQNFKSQRGGGQESGHRGGTENYPAVAGMLAALQAVEEDLAAKQLDRIAIRKTFETKIRERIPGIKIIAEDSNRLWNTSQIILPAQKNLRWITRLNRLKMDVSAGSACATGKTGPSPVLQAMGVPSEEIQRAIRISSAWDTSLEEWMALAEALKQTWDEFNNPDRPSNRTNVITI